jgi:dihydrofolate synthase/folylpolyglutamate synthase
MTYDEVRRWWFGRVDYERKAPRPGDLKLDRMRELLHRLGDPHLDFKSVHVAGSKGKGSTCAMLESVLRHAGYRTGLFTSPHLTDARERIQVDNQPITPDELVAVAQVVRPVVEAMEREDQSPTFFEVTTALGFSHFARQKVEIAVVEVGLGGQFDATNVLTPLVSVITSISLDHTAILGETVEKIAFEKAGIIKPGVPAISGVVALGPGGIIERVAAERDAPLLQSGRDFDGAFHLSRVAGDGTITPGYVRLMRGANISPPYELHLLGAHQDQNAATALATIDVLRARGVAIPDTAIARGLAGVVWPARLEVLPTRPLSVLDCAHNVASAEALAIALRDAFPPMPKSLIFAASNDKDAGGMFHVLAPHFERFFLTRSESPRAILPEELARLLPQESDFACLERPIDAWEAARSATPADGLIVVAGSVYLAGELRPHLLALSQSAKRL